MEHKRNNFLDGFIMGAAVGGVAVFLFGTKKGREVLKILQEEGKDRFSKLEGILSDYQGVLRHPGEFVEEIEEAARELPSKVEEAKRSTKTSSEKPKSEIRKRLFKGITKRKSS